MLVSTTTLVYYRYFALGIPSNTGSTNCGDGTTTLNYFIHPSTNVTSGTSGPNQTLKFTMPTITNGLTYDPLCNISATIQANFVNAINNSSTGTSNNFTGTTLTGSKYTNPFYQVRSACSGVTSSSAVTINGLVDIPKYLNETIVYTGTTPTLVNSLSAQTFNFSYPRFTEVAQSSNLSYYRRYQFSYISVLNNPSDFRDFQIYANSFTGGTLGTSSLIYSYTGATSASTIHDPSYFI